MLNSKLKREKRILDEAHFMINGKHTLRTTAKQFNVGKSTVHLDVTRELKEINYPLYLEVQKVIKFNKSQRAIRSGIGMKKRKERLNCKTS
ncbi:MULTISPECIES: sporulation transcriptional regulator SpoIIID [Clostridium]|uniref:sporulation transcriptional regulator SpoIIID n=1 Tax=Clostridium TaxID=1485 RepID=UPI002430246E|nr:sporulation transcriptional regulator SpoIIID [Clostridium tyrobutyricum]